MSTFISPVTNTLPLIVSFMEEKEIRSLLEIQKTDEKLRSAVLTVFCHKFLGKLQVSEISKKIDWAYQLTGSSQESKNLAEPIKTILHTLITSIEKTSKTIKQEKNQDLFPKILETAVFIRETSKKVNDMIKIVNLYSLCLALEYGPDSWFAKMKNNPEHICESCPHNKKVAMKWFKMNSKVFIKKFIHEPLYDKSKEKKIPPLCDLKACYRGRCTDGLAITDAPSLSKWKYIAVMKKTKKHKFSWIDIEDL